MAKKIAFIAESLDVVHKFQSLFTKIDAEVLSCSSFMSSKVLAENPDIDLVVVEAGPDPTQLLAEIAESLADGGEASILAIVKDSEICGLSLPVKFNSDFVSENASNEECLARMSMLLTPGTEASISDVLRLGNMTINLATYQVKVNDEPLDLTYLEYALLSFLATHPGRTYSRETLLRRVWGFDYYGGSRTVDVHVRRIRAKLGPELAQHLETVRGVGYLWYL